MSREHLRTHIADIAVSVLEGSPWVIKGHEREVVESTLDGVIEILLGLLNT